MNRDLSFIIINEVYKNVFSSKLKWRNDISVLKDLPPQT